MQTEDRLIQAALAGDAVRCSALIWEELSRLAHRFRRGMLTEDELLSQLMNDSIKRYDRLFGTFRHPGPLRGKGVSEAVLAALGIPISWETPLPADLPAPRYGVNDTNQIITVFSLRLPESVALTGTAEDVGLSFTLTGEHGVCANVTLKALHERRFPIEEYTYDAEGFIKGYTTDRVRPLKLCWREGKTQAHLSFTQDRSEESKADRAAFEAHWAPYCAHMEERGRENLAFFQSYAERLIQAAEEG